MSRFRVYIKPFLSSGAYASSYTEVSSDADIQSIGSIKETIDADEYEVGLFKFNQFRLVLNNISGKYSDVGEANTIFAFKRSDSLVRITWQIENDIIQCGNAVCGEVRLSEEITIFDGLLNDESLALDVSKQKLNFQALGMESIFDRVEVNYASLSNGDTISEAIYTILNQTAITELLTVDLGNIAPDTDVEIDDKSDFENTTVKEALDDLLFLGNAVLYIKDLTVYVTDRTASVSVEATFYGQASVLGIEDILQMKNIRNGLNKMFNFWTWEDTTNVQSDSTSIDTYGVKKNEIGSSIITNSTKIDTILTNLKTEFKDPKQEMEITIPVSYENLDLFILDRIAIDYPTVFISGNDESIPLYGAAFYGTSFYPKGKWTITIPVTNNYKILSRKIDTKRQIITFKIKLI